MNALILSSILFCSQFGFSQSIDFNKIRFRGVSFYASQEEIVSKLGKPKKVYKPNYECGFLSSDEQGVEFHTLDYGSVKFTGNKTDKFVMETINFENDNSIIADYEDHKLSGSTTLKELINIFGENLKQTQSENSTEQFILRQGLHDDAIVFKVKNGKLVQITYWSPC